MIDRSNAIPESRDSAGLNRRTVLMTAAAAATTMAGASPALADTVPAVVDTVASDNFGAPLVELHVPASVLTLEQKAAMIKGLTDVVSKAMKLPADPARKCFVQIIETAEGGFGVNGDVFTPRPR